MLFSENRALPCLIDVMVYHKFLIRMTTFGYPPFSDRRAFHLRSISDDF
jgi:hypothetical protein